MVADGLMQDTRSSAALIVILKDESPKYCMFNRLLRTLLWKVSEIDEFILNLIVLEDCGVEPLVEIVFFTNSLTHGGLVMQIYVSEWGHPWSR